MRPLWQVHQLRFGSNLWRCSTPTSFLSPPHLNFLNLTGAWPPQDARDRPFVAQQHALLSTHLTGQQFHMQSDNMSGNNFTDSGKRTYSMMNSFSTSSSGSSQISIDSGGILAQAKQLHAGQNTSNLSEPDPNKDEANAEKRNQWEDENNEMTIRSYLDLRKWHNLAQSNRSSDDRIQEFHLISYNILAQQLLEMNDYLYDHCDPRVLTWSHRRRLLLNELNNFDSDIMCLQEMQDNHYYDDFQPFLSRKGYDSVYKKRTGNKHDGCAIFYRRDTFELEKWVPVEYNIPGVPVLNRDNIGIVALFRPKAEQTTSSRLCVATTHLLFNPKRGDVKLAQLQVLLAEIDKMAFRRLSPIGKTRYHPVILCGDMNSEPHCDIYSFVSTGMLNYEGLPVASMSGQKRFSNSWNLSSELIPRWVGITDECQYSRALKERKNGVAIADVSAEVVSSNSNNQNAPAADDMSLTTSCQEGIPCASTSSDMEETFCSGSMLHHLNLMSVYKHELERLPGAREVTTQHTRASCTVDYIFYSVMKKKSYSQVSQGGKVVHDNVKENNLKLLAYYGLLNGTELRHCGGLPNALAPSDHLPLAAKFSLKL